MATIDIEKINIIISYLADKVEDLYVTKLMKLLYYIDFISLKERGSSITNDTYYKLPYGPIPSFIMNEINNLQTNPDAEWGSRFSDNLIVVPDKFGKKVERIGKSVCDTSKIAPYEIELINEVISKLGNKTAKFLSDKTHQEKPFLLTSENSIIDQSLATSLSGRDILD